MDKTLRSVETCKFSAIFVELGLEALVLVVCVPLTADVLLVVVVILLVVAEPPLVVVLLLEVVVV
jgi:hypothetical protein